MQFKYSKNAVCIKEALRIFSQKYKWKQESNTSKLEEIF